MTVYPAVVGTGVSKVAEIPVAEVKAITAATVEACAYCESAAIVATIEQVEAELVIVTTPVVDPTEQPPPDATKVMAPVPTDAVAASVTVFGNVSAVGIGAFIVSVLDPREMVKVDVADAALKFVLEAALAFKEQVPTAVHERVVPVIEHPAVPGVPTVASA